LGRLAEQHLVALKNRHTGAFPGFSGAVELV
jgi:hypothetical protein